MIERIALLLTRWQIVAAGVVALLAGLVVIAFLAHLGYALLPGAYGWVAVFHIIGSGAAGFYISRPFIEAWMFRHLLDGWQKIIRPPLDVFDEDGK